MRIFEVGWNDDFYHDLDCPFKRLKTTAGLLRELKRRFSFSPLFAPSHNPYNISPYGANLTGMMMRIGDQMQIGVAHAESLLLNAYADLFSTDRKERSVEDMEEGLKLWGYHSMMSLIDRALEIESGKKEKVENGDSPVE